MSPAILVGHSMGCRVVVEAALQAPRLTAGVIVVDGSQFAATMQAVLQAKFGEPDGYDATVKALFNDMFTSKTDPAVVASITARAKRLSRTVGEKMLTDMQRYDVGRLASSLKSLRVPVMALQSTYSNEKRERRPLRAGQNSPYLDMLRASIPSVRVEVIAETGHFPQLDESQQTNALIDSFLEDLATG